MERGTMLDILDDLAEEEFKRFKFYLQDLKGQRTIQKSVLEKSDRPDTATKIIETYKPAEVQQITKEVLMKINRNDLVQKYSSELEGQPEVNATANRAEEEIHTERSTNCLRKCFINCCLWCQTCCDPVQPDGKKSRISLTSLHPTNDETEDMNEISRNNQDQRTIETLFGKLHLQEQFHQNLSLADFLKLRHSVKQKHPTSEKDLVHLFLQKIQVLDYRARNVSVLDNVVDDDLDAFLSTSVKTGASAQTHVHPMDVQMATFLSSDSFLQQNMVTKLSQCQYALTLLVPHPLTGDVQFPLWTFRQIIKTWKTPSTMKSVPVYKAQTPMVSFLRLGSLSVSKSQLMNDLINERHSTFFHRNCAGSTKTRLLMDGVAEIAWYCPAGKPNDAFTDCIAFCNLHGDALEFERQREILVGKSSVNVVLVPTLEKGDKSWTVITELCESSKPLIVLIAGADDGTVQMNNKGKTFKIGLKDRSQSEVCQKLKKIIEKILSGPHESFQLETLAEVSGLRVDEDDPACRNGKSAAMNVVELFKGKNVSNIKDEFLPCQGDLWHNWCRINKELYHLKGNIEMEKSKKQQELMQIRRDQMERCTASNSELMKLFINGLSSLSSPDREYFLKWTQVLIDALSTDDLTSLLQDYDKTWSKILALKKKHKSDQLKIKQTELEQISKKLQSATFGLEHIFREMGQIYEAHKSLNKRPEEVLTHWSKYLELAAELMISGHPMELMDGDAGHVPLTWVSSVLDEVRRKLGDCRVFVLSVLGVQSSGKSTMLNAMFGLQFAVSAGRCTKGAFMQLVKVSEEMKHLKFDYVLVVDTEGLRALELEGTNTLHHDNELATFVVGLGNMTLINIFGENPAEMQDVLQIVVQAFMRMKKVKLSPSCVFVHQNVTDITAAEKNMDGKRRLQEKLDQMVQLAAKEEGSDAECFSDIIAFDVQTDVKYFAQLWEGSPPMAPPNPGYSESVQELKDFILTKASRSDGVTLSQFRGKIQDLWDALLRENFVFSFKNTLEISVYRKLEVEYGNWTWTLRSNMLTIENQLHTRIENGRLDKLESSYVYKEISETYEEIKKQMTKYFEDEKDKEMLVQWQSQFETKIKDFQDEQVKEVKRKLDEVLQQKKACKKWEETKTEFETKLLQKSKELAHKLKDKNKDEEELSSQFNFMWSDWVTEVTATTTPIEDINFEDDQFNILQDLGIEWTLIHESKSSDEYKNISKIGDYSKYVSNTKQQEQTSCDTSQQTDDDKQNKWGQRLWRFIKGTFGYGSAQQTEPDTSSSLPHENQISIRSLINNVAQETMTIIMSKPVATRGYTSTYLKEVADNVKDKVVEFESQKKYALKKEFTVDLLLFVFDRAEKWISESQETFNKNNDAATFVNSKKSQYYNVFRSYCKGASSAVVLGGLICEKLKVSSVEAVCNQTAIDLATEMRCDYPAFNGNRLKLEKHVLKSLAEKEDFNGFITYIQNPRQQVENFIKEEVKKYIFTEHKEKALKILKKNVEDISRVVSQALLTATEKVKTLRGDANMWLKEFLNLLKDELIIDTISSQNFNDINNFDILKEEAEKVLLSIIKDMRTMSLDKINAFRQKPDQILIDQLCRCCWVQCPFCGAVCTNTLEDHSSDHSVPLHRFAALSDLHCSSAAELSVDFCTTKVASDDSFYPCVDSHEILPYKLYRTAGPAFAKWSINADESNLKYWKWVVCRFQTQLENYYNDKFQNLGEIPSEWKTYSKEEAIQSLDEM